MPEESVAIVRRYMEMAADIEPQQIPDCVAEFFDSGGDYYPVPKFPEARPCHGREEISRFLTEFRLAWDRFEFSFKELTPVDDDRVLARTTLLAEGRESGLSLEGDIYHCFWLRHGRFFRVEDHLTLDRALRALGLDGDTLEAAGLA